ncbi:MAG: DNA mismatch repair endonuclease MutL, partial [Syntrophomonadaceae bacterium]|nr:DNA mismatch repair endonuclease MutL [Syntrophomonadaceae bacterium]
MTIKLLDDNLINKIAAGEVIERPASIVKELVENAMDAGSDRIEVHIDAGGTERIEVSDNGTGIRAAEVELALQRHATSKITREEDLYSIATMGFRGEALPSIAAVSRMELFTQAGSEPGVHAVVEGGRQILLQPYPTAPGTVVVVRDIFFNTPARKKFLKTPVGEGMQVHEVMNRIALSRPDITFTFSSEKRLYFKTPGNGNLRDTTAAIYGHDFAASFLDLDFGGEKHTLSGLISKPEMRRVNRKNQVFFINRRLVKSPMLSRALEEAYRGLLLSREYPAAILFLTVPADEVDVNVHPRKTEVRFRDEKTIFSIISRSVRARLDNVQTAGSNSWSSPAWASSRSASDLAFPAHGQVWTAEKGLVSEARLDFESGIASPVLPRTESLGTESFESSEFTIIGQVFGSFILVETGDNLWLVDQHAAHERIQFNRLQEASQDKGSTSQVLAFPLAFDLSAAETAMIEANQDLFAQMGFAIESLGPQAAIIRSAPSLLQGQEIESIRNCL